jgi:acyl-coenzyme A thioesterase PaaI-like protein
MCIIPICRFAPNLESFTVHSENTMSITRYLTQKFHRSNAKVFGFFMNLYPPFIFFGIRIKFTPDFLQCNLKISNRWYFRNGHGTMFGGAMLAATDPLPAVQLSKIFRKHHVWSMTHHVKFKKPAKTKLSAKIVLNDQEIIHIKETLKKHGKSINTFSYLLFDTQNEIVAEINSTVYIRNPRHSLFLSNK